MRPRPHSLISINYIHILAWSILEPKALVGGFLYPFLYVPSCRFWYPDSVWSGSAFCLGNVFVPVCALYIRIGLYFIFYTWFLATSLAFFVTCRWYTVL
jgi:hypothetical protein